ncbi:MAG: Phage derived protein Gp49-like [Thermoleophilia bacterium]|nr:Phage derived protein Gp49-like [Thermoleophilia bacterium]
MDVADKLPSGWVVSHRSIRRWIKWLGQLDTLNAARIARKMERLAAHGPDIGMPVVRRLGRGVCELRVDKYRMYFIVRPGRVIEFVRYGDKDTQRRDISEMQKEL